MTLYQSLLSIAILLGLGVFIYSGIKKQSIKDTIMEIKEIIQEAVHKDG